MNADPNASKFLGPEWWSMSKAIHDFFRNFLIAITFLAASNVLRSDQKNIPEVLGFSPNVTGHVLLVLAVVLLTINIMAAFSYFLVRYKANQIPRDGFGRLGYFVFVLITLVPLCWITLVLCIYIVKIGLK
jgi:hypothetical protein